MRSTYDTRGSSSRFQLPLPKTNYGKNSFGYRGQFIWNKLPEDLLGYKPQCTYIKPLNWTAWFSASSIPYYNPSLEYFIQG